MRIYTKNSYVGGYFVAFKNELLDSNFYTLQYAKMEKNYFSVSWELEKLAKNGYCYMQVYEIVNLWLKEWKTTIKDIIETLVYIKRDELYLSTRMEKIKKAINY